MGSFDPIAYYFAKKALKIAIPKLSLLIVDVDKDWGGKRIRNIGPPLTSNDVPRARAEDVLSGVFSPNRIPDLDAGKITSGIFDIARIPDLDASKIVSGTLNPGRIPNLLRAKISDLWDVPFWPNIPDKPSAFPPEAHAHGRSEVFDLWSSPFWPNIPDKPTEFVDAEGILQKLRDFEVFWFINHWMPDILLSDVTGNGRVDYPDPETCSLSIVEPYEVGSTASVWKDHYGFTGRSTWDAIRYFGCHVYIMENTNQVIKIVSGSTDDTLPHIGFKVVNNELYGTVSDGAEESTLLLATIPSPFEAKLEAILTPGSECRFYINGEDKGAITTHLPKGEIWAYKIFNAKITNTEAEVKSLDIYEVRVIQLSAPPSPCPMGEQIVNGGFETGNLTGWTVVGRHITRPFYDWDAVFGGPEASSEWKLHGNYSMKVVSQGTQVRVVETISIDPCYAAVFGFLLVSGEFSATRRSNIFFVSEAGDWRSMAGFAIKRVGETDYFFFVWRTSAGEFEENTGVVVNRNQVYWLQVGVKQSDRNVPNGYARGWINGVQVADKSNIVNRTTPWLLTLGLHACVNYPYEGSATNVVAFFDDVVAHNTYISTNPFENGGPFFWQCGFEYFEDLGPAWDVTNQDAWGNGPTEGNFMARIRPLETDFIGDVGCPRITGELQQIFAKPIPYSCFGEEAIFEVKTKWNTDYCNPVPPDTWLIEILYTDGTSTTLDIRGDPRGEWVTHDLKAILEPGKDVKGIKFKATVDRCGGVGINWTEALVDGCTIIPSPGIPRQAKITFKIPPLTDPPACRCKGYWMVEGRKVHDGETLTMNIGIHTNVVPRIATYEDPQYDPSYPCNNNFIWKVETDGDVSYDLEKSELTVRGDGAVIAYIGCMY